MKSTTIFAASLLTTASCFGALGFLGPETDASGNVITGSIVTVGGTIGSSVSNDGAGGIGFSNLDTLATGATMVELGLTNPLEVNSNGRLNGHENAITATMDYTAIGGTIDLHAGSRNFGGQSGFAVWVVDVGAGVSSITYELNYQGDRSMHGINAPMSSFISPAGSGQFNATYELLGVPASSVTAPSPAEGSLPYDTWDSATNTATWNSVASSSPGRRGINNFNDSTLEDDIFTGIKITLDAVDGSGNPTTFASGTQFRFTVDGGAVPEPSALMFSSLTGLLLLTQRRRRF